MGGCHPPTIPAGNHNVTDTFQAAPIHLACHAPPEMLRGYIRLKEKQDDKLDVTQYGAHKHRLKTMEKDRKKSQNVKGYRNLL